MIPKPSWDASYLEGVSLLQEGATGEALRSFDEAVHLGGWEALVFDSRDKVSERLRRLEGVFQRENAVEVDESVEEANERLFRCFSLLSPSLQLSLVDSHIPTRHHYTTPSLLDIAQSHYNLFYASRDLTSFLPPEILLQIGRLVVARSGSSDVAFTLAAVSGRWRTLFMGDSQLWGTLELDQSTTALPKLEAFLEKGDIVDLRVDFSLHEKQVGHRRWRYILESLRPSMSRLLSLQFQLVDRRTTDDLSQFLAFASNLESLHLDDAVFGFEGLLRFAPSNRPFTHLRQLKLSSVIDGQEGDASLTPLLFLLPSLVTLDVSNSNFDIFGPDLPPSYTVPSSTPRRTTISFPNLTSISFRGTHEEYLVRPEPNPINPILPRLERLELVDLFHGSYIPYLFPSFPPPNTDHLTHLLLESISVDETIFIQHLPLLPALTHLHLRFTFPRSLTEAFVKALIIPSDGVEGGGACPLLEEISFGWPHGIEEGLGRIVASRRREGRALLRVIIGRKRMVFDQAG